MFVYQATSTMLDLKKDNGTDYVTDRKPQDLFESFKSSFTWCFLNEHKYFGCKIGTPFKNIPLVVKQNDYSTKSVNAYITYELGDRPKVLLRSFTLKNYLFSVTNIVENSNKGNYVYSGYLIAFDGEDSRSFGNDFVGNVEMFGVANSSSSNNDDYKNNFLVLGEGDTSGINGSLGALKKKKFSVNFSEEKTKFCLSLHNSGDNSYLFVNGEKIYKFKANNKNVNFPN